ncbi:26S protease regulatory subunit S10B, partial [Nosema bombycis CQ1]
MQDSHEVQRVHEDYLKAIQTNETVYNTVKMEQEIFKQTNKQFLKTERDVKSLQTVGHIIGEVLKKLTDEKFIVKSSQGPRYVVGCMKNIDRNLLQSGTRVALDITTLTTMLVLPREVDPMIYAMSEEKPVDISFGEIPLPNDQGRKEILKIHSKDMQIEEELDYDVLVKLSANFNGADLRNICTEAGMMAIRGERDYAIQEDFVKAARKIAETKRLESKLDYKKK